MSAMTPSLLLQPTCIYTLCQTRLTNTQPAPSTHIRTLSRSHTHTPTHTTTPTTHNPTHTHPQTLPLTRHTHPPPATHTHTHTNPPPQSLSLSLCSESGGFCPAPPLLINSLSKILIYSTALSSSRVVYSGNSVFCS